MSTPPKGIEIRAAESSDYEAFYGRPLPHTAFGVVVEEDGKLIGLGGYALKPEGAIVFFDAKVDPAKYRRTLITAARRVFCAAAKLRRPVYAYREPGNPKSERLLRHWGFEAATQVDGLEIWKWQTR